MHADDSLVHQACEGFLTWRRAGLAGAQENSPCAKNRNAGRACHQGFLLHRAAVLADVSGWPGDAGPAPASVWRIAAAISSRSSVASVIHAASIQPSTCSGVRAPTIAPVTPGHASVQATAIADTDVP